MKCTFSCKKINLRDSIKDYTDKKLAKLADTAGLPTMGMNNEQKAKLFIESIKEFKEIQKLTLPLKSTFSLTIILTPLEAINPYKINDTPPVIQAGTVCNNNVKGAKKPNAIENNEAKIITDENKCADGRKRALDNNERYNLKRKRKEKGYWNNFPWLCSIDVWYGSNVRCCKWS